MPDDLNGLRRRLDAIDRRLVDALAARQHVVRRAAACKSASGAPVRDHDREREMLRRLGAQARAAGLSSHFVQALYREILNHSVRYQTRCRAAESRALEEGRAPEERAAPVTVAYQGAPGAYSHLAALRHFGAHGAGVTCQGHVAFEDAFRAVEEGRADCALLPVENTTSGAVNAVCDLLAQYRLPIVGEEVLHVDHCLLTSAPVDAQHVRRILSHPQALAQCGRYLAGLPHARAEAFADTALAAKKVKEDGDPAQAAIASEAAARQYGLHVAARGLADQRENYTRFVVVAPEADWRASPASCSTASTAGATSRIEVARRK